MQVPCGKHENLTVELLLLRDPRYVLSIIRTVTAGPLSPIRAELKRLISVFNSKPLQVKCCDCGAPATCYSVWQGGLDLEWRCGCYRPNNNVLGEKILVLSYYLETVLYAKTYLSWRSDASKLVRTVARAKGLPVRVGKKQAQAFFQTGPSAFELWLQRNPFGGNAPRTNINKGR